MSTWTDSPIRSVEVQPVDYSVRGERTADVVARRLGQAIIGGELVPGTRLTENSLADRYSVSRTPIREALIKLSVSGLVVLEANRGATVSQLTASDVAESYHLRAVLESEAAALTADRAPQDVLEVLQHACDELSLLHAATASSQLAADTRFHYTIAAASGSGRLHAMIRQVSAISEAYRSTFAYDGVDIKEAERQHRAIAGAIARADRAEAGDAMRRHIHWAGGLALRRLGSRLAPATPECGDGS